MVPPSDSHSDEPSGGHSGEGSGEPSAGHRRVTVQEAMQALGISEHAVRQRIRRGTLDSDRDEDGRVHVYLSAPSDETSGGESGEPSGGGSADSAAQYPGQPELIEALQDQVQYLRAELEAERDARRREVEAEREARRRADHIIAALTERIPELEAPPQSAQEAESVAESASGGADREEAAEGRREAQGDAWQPERRSERPWWRRLFGG